jgi:hypothetical protein
MNKILQVAKVLALLAVCVLCVVASVRISQVSSQINVTLRQLDLSGTVANLNATLDAIHRPCGKTLDTVSVLFDKTRNDYFLANKKKEFLPCGTLADVAKTLGTIRGAAGQIEVAANHEDKRIAVLDGQEATIYRNTNASLLQLREDLRTANTTIAGLQPVFVGLTKDAAAVEVTTESARALIANPQIPVILNNTAAATGSVSQAAGHLDATTADVQHAVHQALHPTVVHKVLDVMENVGHVVFAIVF